MFVACVVLKVEGRQVKPGEPVPEAYRWQESVRRAHINLGWIKEDGELSATTTANPFAGAAATDGTASVKPKAAKRSKKIAS
jgi:hypothetical protein